MAFYLNLTRVGDGDKSVYVNMDLVQRMRILKGPTGASNTSLQFGKDDVVRVTETPSQIIAMLDGTRRAGIAR